MSKVVNFLELGVIPYSEYLTKLEELTKDVSANSSKIYLMSCTHPPVYTHGSGLEKSKGQIVKNLKDFDLNLSSHLDYEFHKIKRGGGLTFHYPGQLIFYPVFHLTYQKKNLQVFMMRLLKMASDSLNEMLETDLFHYKGEFLGLWHDDKKVGSIGMGLNRYITQHGMALNITSFQNSQIDLSLCGIQKSIYSNINEVTGRELNLNHFNKQIENKFLEFFS